MSTSNTTPPPNNPLLDNAVTIGMGLSLAKLLVQELTKSKAPAEAIDAAQNVVSMLAAHWNDAVTKANLEALRG